MGESDHQRVNAEHRFVNGLRITESMRQAARDLESTRCRCNEKKPSGKSFCYRCYGLLPAEVQKGLYRRIGDCYEENFAYCCELLDNLGRPSGAADQHRLEGM